MGATHLIDAATLTGACVVALGMINAGVFANDDGFYNQFNRVLAKSGEKMWRLPAEDDYKEMIKSDIADIKNTGGRWGGAITAAMFLKEFVERHSVDASRHRRHGLDRRQQALDRQRAVGRAGAFAGGVCAGLRQREVAWNATAEDIQAARAHFNFEPLHL